MQLLIVNFHALWCSESSFPQIKKSFLFSYSLPSVQEPRIETYNCFIDNKTLFRFVRYFLFIDETTEAKKGTFISNRKMTNDALRI